MIQKLDDIILNIHEKALDLTIKTVGADKYSCATQANIAKTVGYGGLSGYLITQGINHSSGLLTAVGGLLGLGAILSYRSDQRKIERQRKIDEDNALNGTRKFSQYNPIRPLIWSFGVYEITRIPLSENIPELIQHISFALYFLGNESTKYFLELDAPSGKTKSLLDKVKEGISNVEMEPVKINSQKYESNLYSKEQ